MLCVDFLFDGRVGWADTKKFPKIQLHLSLKIDLGFISLVAHSPLIPIPMLSCGGGCAFKIFLTNTRLAHVLIRAFPTYQK